MQLKFKKTWEKKKRIFKRYLLLL